jgi:hypothetical protein
MRASALDSSVAFRDETEALRARIDSLESELGEANETIAYMKGADELTGLDKFDKLPPRPFGWKRRVRRFGIADYEHLARVVPTLTQLTMTSARAGRGFTMTSPTERIVVMAGEDDEMILVFDEYDLKLRQVLTPLALAILSFVAVNDPSIPHEYWPIMMGLGVLVSSVVYALFARLNSKRFAKGDKLFEAIGAHLERSLTGSKSASSIAQPEQEEVEVEQRSASKEMEA